MPDSRQEDFGREYDVNSHRALLAAYLLIAGLLVELINAVVWFEGAKTLAEIAAVLLIVAGVWGEVFFANKARQAGDKQLAQYEARSAEADQKAKEAEFALAQLEARLAPRRLTQEGQNRIAERISEYAGIAGSIGSSPRNRKYTARNGHSRRASDRQVAKTTSLGGL